MAKEVENQGIINMTDRQVFDELINLHAKAAGEAREWRLRCFRAISTPRDCVISMQDMRRHWPLSSSQPWQFFHRYLYS